MSGLKPTLFDSYRELYRPYVNAVNVRLAKYNLYTTQWSVLRLINYLNSCTSAEIAKEMRVEKPSITPTIKKLIELGFVEVTQGEDKREKYVCLSQKGNEVYISIHQELATFLNELTEGINEEDLKTTRDVLNQILENLLK